MESPTQPSFIPQDAVVSSRRVNTAGLPELVMLASVLLLVVSGGLAGAVFVYQQYLQSSMKAKTDQLSRAQSAFQPALVVQLERLDDRMSTAETLLHGHIAPSALLSAVEQATNQNISFTSFDFNASDPLHMSLSMGGIAASVNSIALQADLFGKSGVFTSPIFSGIDREKDGVHFQFSGIVTPATVNYAQQASAATADALPTQQVQQTQQTQPTSPFTTRPSANGASSTPAAPNR